MFCSIKSLRFLNDAFFVFKHPEAKKTRRKACYERLKANGYYEKYYAENKEIRNKKRRIYKRSMPQGFNSNFVDRIRKSVRDAIKRGNYTKKSHTHVMLGADYNTVYTHLTREGQASLKGMHIDHIVPCAQAKNEEELIKLQHYTNLQLLTPAENSSKFTSKTAGAEELCLALLGRKWED